jgi:ribonuclease-3
VNDLASLPLPAGQEPVGALEDAERLARAEAALGVAFQDRELLRRALTHRSYVNELGRDARDSNERLEFLGDALLGFLVADWLFARFDDLPEGDLTARRVALIRTDTLAHWSRQLGLGSLLYLSKGDTARAFLARRLVEADAIIARMATENYKGRLQELVQDPGQRPKILTGDGGLPVGGGRFTPVYVVVARGLPATDSAFTVEVRVDGRAIGVGEGSNKRLAEQAAARDALMNLGKYEVRSTEYE